MSDSAEPAGSASPGAPGTPGAAGAASAPGAAGTHGAVGTVGELGEFGLIDAWRARLPIGPDVLVGPGDDAALLEVPDGRTLVSTDVLLEGRHFRRDWSGAYDIGRRAAAQNLADIAAMGGRSQALVIGLGVPSDLPVAYALELADGLRDECERAGASVAGGDTVASDSIVLAVTVLGTTDGGAPVLRRGAQPGDTVAVCGRLGWSAGGLAVLGRGFRSPRVLVEAFRRPEPPYDAGPEAARLGATAMIDTSDGLLADLGHIASASGVAIDLAGKAFEVPEPLHAVAAATGTEAMAYVLTGGEDHALVATFPSGVELPERWRRIGRVTGLAEPGAVTVDGQAYDRPAGHRHF